MIIKPCLIKPGFIKLCLNDMFCWCERSLIALIYKRKQRKIRTERDLYDAGADEQEPATPILSLCHGIFTD